MDQLRLTWGVPEEVLVPYELAASEGKDVDFLEAAGFTSEALAAMEAGAPVDLRVTQKEGSVGAGASGYGVTVVLDLLGHVSDIGGVIALGEFVRRLIAKHLRERGEPTISDPDTLGAVAAASLVEPAMQARLAGCHFAGTVPITAFPSSGTDARDIWASCFGGDGFAIVIFMSPSGLCLGSVAVPAEWGTIDGEFRTRSPEEIAAWWGRPR